jgi:hypothetical protein
MPLAYRGSGFAPLRAGNDAGVPSRSSVATRNRSVRPLSAVLLAALCTFASGCTGATVRAGEQPPQTAPLRPLVLGDHRTVVGFLEHVTSLEHAADQGPERDPVTLASGRTLYLDGWLVDLAQARPLRALQVDIDGRRRIDAHLGEVRPELRDYFPSVPPLVAAFGGFAAVVPPAGLVPGVHRFDLTAVEANGRRFELVRGFPFRIVDARRR